MKLRAILALTLIVAGAAPAAENKARPDPPAPFGIAMGAKKERVANIVREVEPFLYVLSDVPKPHEAFTSYSVRIAPKAGVCFIKAFGRDVATNAQGTQLRLEFGLIRAELEAVYGKPVTVDQLQAESTLKQDKDWMNSLLRNERVLGSRWSAEDGSKMKPGIKTIDLVAAARTESEGFLVLEYTFTNIEQCQAELEQAAKASPF
jgi:hypothetical protein